MAIQRTPLQSTALSSCSYDEDTETLEITFSGGRTFSYEGVPKSVYDGLVSSDSPGRYFNTAIKGVYG